MARAYWPDQSHSARNGLRVRYTMMTVVGVVGDVRFNPNAGPAEAPTYYVAVAQATLVNMSLVIRTKGDPAAMTRRIERDRERRADRGAAAC
jgi:hypothetical protein